MGLFVAAIALFFSIRQCRNNAIDAENWKGKYTYQNQVIDSFKNNKGIKVVEQKVAETNDKDELKKLSAQLFDLKKGMERKIKEVKALVKANQQVDIVDDTIPYTTDNPVKLEDYYTNDTLVHKDSVIIPPRSFAVNDSNYSLHGKVLLTGVMIDSLRLQNTISFRIAEKKTGLFKRETVAQAINSNPLFHNTGMNSIVLKKKTTAWNKWIKPALTAGITLFIQSKLKL